MKLVRIAAISVLVLAFLAMVGAGVALHYQNQLVAAVLREVSRRSGVQIVAESSQLEFRNHLIIVLERARVLSQAGEIASMDRLTAAISYHAIFYNSGLPLYALIAEHPRLRLPFDASKASSPGLVRLESWMVQEGLGFLAKLAKVGKRFGAVDLEATDQSGLPLVQQAGLMVFHRRRSPGVWHIALNAIAASPPLKGLHVAVSVRAGTGAKIPAHVALLGRLLYWEMPLEGLSIESFTVSGKSQGKLELRLGDNGAIEGRAELGFKYLEARGPELTGPLELGDCTFDSPFSVSEGRIALSHATLRRAEVQVLGGEVHIDQPYGQNPQVGLEITRLQIAWNDFVQRIRMFRRVPSWLTALTGSVKGGLIRIDSASLESPLDKLRSLERETLLKKLVVSTSFSGVNAVLPPETDLPPVQDLQFQLRYANAVLSVTQGSGQIGDSTLRRLSAQANVTHAPKNLPYKLSLEAEADLDDLKPAVLKGVGALGLPEPERLESLGGRAEVMLDAAGDVVEGRLGPPKQYEIRIEPHRLEVLFKGAPGPITVVSGAVTIEPGRARLHKVGMLATDGTANFNGNLMFRNGVVETYEVRVDMHQMPVEEWLALVVDPGDLSARARMGGELEIRKSSKEGFLADGKLTLASGTMQFGFFRAPMMIQVATVTMQGHRLVLSMPDARLEQEPINFEMTIDDVREPTVRIDAVAQKLDLEVMKFVRMPWTPPTVKYSFKFPVTGHAEIRRAQLEGLSMTNVAADFEYNAGDWRVYNLEARAFGGHIKLELDGRKKDEWIRMRGQITEMQVGPLFLLNPQLVRSPLRGRLDLDADLWADTAGDFFPTMRGRASVKIRDGNLDRFTLFSRLLALIDLKSWLTAQVPDPRVVGIPFRTLTADFKGKDGIFHTENLVLEGPVMDIVANGNFNLDQSTMAMKIGLIPFSTVNWLISNIPLVGQNIAEGTGSLLAAYFNVRGPITDPTVTPAPITSVAELVKKTLGLPINIIRPNTVR